MSEEIDNVSEEILMRFFTGQITASQLADDIAGSEKRSTDIASVVAIEDMDEDFQVTRSMLIALCDAVLSGKLPPEALAAIGFALESSDRFFWDGDEDLLVADVIADWSCPEINYPLTVENVSRFRAWLTGAEVYPSRPANMPSDGRIISVREKKSIGSGWWRRR